MMAAMVFVSCNRERPDGEKMAQEVCDCKSKVPKDERGIAKDFKDLVPCSAMKLKALRKLKDDEAELKKFENKLGQCGDWEFKNK